MNHQKLFTKQKETQEARSLRAYILLLKIQETCQGCLADEFIPKLIYNIFLFKYKIFSFFTVFFTLIFVSHVLCYIFLIRNLLLALDALIVIPVNLNFFLI